jgi:hypothetical protein
MKNVGDYNEERSMGDDDIYQFVLFLSCTDMWNTGL